MVKLGKVIRYDNSVGELVSDDGIYLFTDNDLDKTNTLNKDDLVLFKAEVIHDVKRAYYVELLNEENKKKYIRYLNKDNK